MDVAGLNVRITIQKNGTETDKIGNHKSVWKDYFRCWATASGDNRQVLEEENAGQTVEEDALNFTVRYCSETAAVTSTGYRILLDGRIYNIEHVDDMAFKRRSLKFSCTLVRR